MTTVCPPTCRYLSGVSCPDSTPLYVCCRYDLVLTGTPPLLNRRSLCITDDAGTFCGACRHRRGITCLLYNTPLMDTVSTPLRVSACRTAPTRRLIRSDLSCAAPEVQAVVSCTVAPCAVDLEDP